MLYGVITNNYKLLQRKLLDASLGFAAGVMVAASYWSLLAPAIEKAKESTLYGDKGQFAFVPVGIGFFLGALFVYGTDVLITVLGVQSPFGNTFGKLDRKPLPVHKLVMKVFNILQHSYVLLKKKMNLQDYYVRHQMYN